MGFLRAVFFSLAALLAMAWVGSLAGCIVYTLEKARGIAAILGLVSMASLGATVLCLIVAAHFGVKADAKKEKDGEGS